jgi:hypothetical protein
MSDLSSATTANFHSALEEFEAAWENPTHTRFTLPAVQVNSVLAKEYTTSRCGFRMALRQRPYGDFLDSLLLSGNRFLLAGVYRRPKPSKSLPLG